MLHTPTAPRLYPPGRTGPSRFGGLLTLLGVALLITGTLLITLLASGPSAQAALAPADLFLSGTVGGQLLVDDPALLELDFASGLQIVVDDPVFPLRIGFEPGTPVVAGMLFDLGVFPLTLELLSDGDAQGRMFSSSEGELIIADGAVQISAYLDDDSGATQFLSARIAVAP